MIYNVRFTSVPTLYFETRLILQGSRVACTVRLRCQKEHGDVLALRLLPLACVAAEDM
jgi:hypothetical protein